MSLDTQRKTRTWLMQSRISKPLLARLQKETGNKSAVKTNFVISHKIAKNSNPFSLIKERLLGFPTLICPENKESTENVPLPVNHSSQEHCRKSRASIIKQSWHFFLTFSSWFWCLCTYENRKSEIAEGRGVMHSLKETAARSDFFMVTGCWDAWDEME